MRDVDRKAFPHEHADYFYSDLQALRSAAGYYLGRMCWDKKGGFPEPLSRESGYFATKEEAELALKTGFQVRECAENEHAYATGGFPAPHQPEHN